MKVLLGVIAVCVLGGIEPTLQKPQPKIYFTSSSVDVNEIKELSKISFKGSLNNNLACGVKDLRVHVKLVEFKPKTQTAKVAQKGREKELKWNLGEIIPSGSTKEIQFSTEINDLAFKPEYFSLSIYSYTLANAALSCVEALMEARTKADARAFVLSFGLHENDAGKRAVYDRFSTRAELETFFKARLNSLLGNFKSEAAIQAMLYSAQALSVIGSKEIASVYTNAIETLNHSENENYFELFKLQQLNEQGDALVFSRTLPMSLKSMREALHFSSLEHGRLWVQRKEIAELKETPQVLRKIKPLWSKYTGQESGPFPVLLLLGMFLVLLVLAIALMRKWRK